VGYGSCRPCGRAKRPARPQRLGKRCAFPTAPTARILTGISDNKAAWAWTGCEGLTVEIADDEAASQWSQLLGEPVIGGQVVTLDGRLTDQLKRRLFAKDLDLAVWILKRSDELGRKYEKREQRLLRN
jgi:hypothetical protein